MDRRRLSACANFIGLADKMERINQATNDHRRLSDGLYPSLLRLPHNNLHYPEEFRGTESCMLKEKNSSLTMLMDSTSSIMRTASSTLHTLIGSTRRASYCGEPDPTIQMSPNGQSGSLYLIPRTSANSSESFASNTSNEEQRRTVTIYDGRLPSVPTTPAIPFELMTPIDAITQTIEDPVESFVQIVLEEPDERPPIIRRLSSSSPSRRSSSPRNRQRQNASNQLTSSSEKLTENETKTVTQLFDSLEIHCRPPEVIEPMDFSFLEPVLGGDISSRSSTSSDRCRENQQKNEESTIDRQFISQPIQSFDENSTSKTQTNYCTLTGECLRIPSIK